jgi:hypothetical protein
LLNRPYPIHAQDIRELIALPNEGSNMTEYFQGVRKHKRRVGEPRLYEKYGMKKRGHGSIINMIYNNQVLVSC